MKRSVLILRELNMFKTQGSDPEKKGKFQVQKKSVSNG